jgi:hypothetical protein
MNKQSIQRLPGSLLVHTRKENKMYVDYSGMLDSHFVEDWIRKN